MARSRVGMAIDAAIAEAKVRTDRQSKFNTQLSKVAKAKSGEREFLQLLKSQGVDFKAQAKIAAERHEQVASRLARLGSGQQSKKPSRHEFPQSLYTTVPPPRDAVPSFPVCLHPADSFSSSSSKPSWATGKAAKAEMDLFLFSQEVGGFAGVLASPAPPPITGSLWHGISPPVGGTLAVIAQVSLSGYLRVYAESWSPIINSSPFVRADALARLVVRTHQIGGTGIQAESLILGEAHASGGEIRGHQWVDDLFVVVLYAQVIPDVPVAIEVSVELEGLGRSTFGRATIDLKGAASQPGISVAALCLNLSPTMIL